MIRLKLCKLETGATVAYDLCTDSLDLGDYSQVDYEYLGKGFLGVSQQVFHFWSKIATEKTIFKEPTWEPKPNPMSDLNNFIDMVNYRFPPPYSVVRYLNPRWCISPSLDVSITDDVTLGCMRK
jgi:hypothetical protein